VAEFQISRSARHPLTLSSVAGSFDSSGSIHVFLRRCSTLQAGGLSTSQYLFKVDLVHDMLQSPGPVLPANLLTLTYSR
jgi:hypothetical protein